MRIALADDHELFLDGLESLVNSLAPQAQIHRARCFDSLMTLPLSTMQAGIVDLKMPGMKTGGAISRLAKALNGRLLVLSSSENQVEREICYEQGAQAFMSKSQTRQQLIVALTQFLHAEPRTPVATPQPANTLALTFRQQQILQSVSDGLTNKQIGTQYSISENTVKKHLSHLFMILDANTRSQCVAKARQLKLL